MDKVLDSKDIGEKIRLFRLMMGLTQEGLAEQLGITFQQVQKYERGITKVNLTKLQQLAQSFKVPVSAFFETDSIPVINLTDDEFRLLSGYRNLKDEQKSSILNIVADLSKK